MPYCVVLYEKTKKLNKYTPVILRIRPVNTVRSSFFARSKQQDDVTKVTRYYIYRMQLTLRSIV